MSLPQTRSADGRKIYELFRPKSPEEWVFVIFLALLPLVVNLRPYDAFLAGSIWRIPVQSDPIYVLRCSFIVVGLVGSAVTLFGYVRTLERGASTELVLWRSAVILMVLIIGWNYFPFWANGVHFVYVRGERIADFDPKALAPAVWRLGGLWYLGVFATALAEILMAPLLFIASVVVAIQTKRWTQNVATAVLLLLGFWLLASHDFWDWLGD